MKYISEKIKNIKNKKIVVTLLICIISLLVLLGVSYASFFIDNLLDILLYNKLSLLELILFLNIFSCYLLPI